MPLKWVNSAGGPLILCDTINAPKWRGIHGSSIATQRTDYDRACSTINFLSVLPSDGFDVLVLGDEPLRSTIFKGALSPAIIRWVSCQSAVIADEALENLPAALPLIEEPVTLHINQEEIVLFDSATAVDEAGEELRSIIAPGGYLIGTELYKEDGVFEFLVHRLVRRDDD